MTGYVAAVGAASWLGRGGAAWSSSTSARGCSTPTARGSSTARPPGCGGEPAVRQTLAAGASLVTFSGDKLLGGPQAGVIAGRADLVERCRRHPLARALRPGGLVLEALQDVVLAYLRGDAGRTVPLWQLAGTPVDDLAAAGRGLRDGPGRRVRSRSWEVAHCPGAHDPVGRGRASPATSPRPCAPPPLRSLARVVDGHTVCDLRTVFPDQDALLAKALGG